MTRREELHPVIVGMRERGMLLREIAAELGLSISTVQDYWSDPTGEHAKRRKLAAVRGCIDCGGRCNTDGSRTDPAVRCRECARIWLASMESRRIQSATNRGRNVWSDTGILSAIRSIAVDGVATVTAYNDAYAAAPRGTMPSVPLIVKRFGLWSLAAKAAGCQISESGKRVAGERWDRIPTEGMLLALQDCVDEIGRPFPAYDQYAAWAQASGSPSATAIRNRFGTWVDALDALESAQVAA